MSWGAEVGIEDLAFALEDRLAAVQGGGVAVLTDPDAVALAERLYLAVDWFAPIEGAVPTARAFNLAVLVATFHWHRYTHTGAEQDLSRSAFLYLVVYGFATHLVPEPIRSAHEKRGHHHHAFTAAELEGFVGHAVSLLRQAERTGAVEPLDDATAVLRWVIWLAPVGHRLGGAAFAELGNVLTRKYEYTGDTDALARALNVNLRALGLLSRNDPYYPVVLSNLGHTTIRRFERDGELEPLRAAIDGLRRAVALAAPDDVNGAAYRTNLAAALTLWYRHTGQAAALDEAVEALTEAVRDTAEDHPDLPSRLGSLAQLLDLRDEASSADEDSTATIITLFRRALSITTDGHPDRPACMLGLASALHTRFESAGDPDDLRMAIDLCRRVCRTMPTTGYLYPKALSGLAQGLQIRFRHFGQRRALDEAVKVLRVAAGALPRDHPERAQLLTELGGALRDRFTAEGRPADRELALQALREASQCASAPAVWRVKAAVDGAGLAAAAHDFTAATELYATALEQLDLAAWRGAERGDQERVLSQFNPLSNEAAACAIRAGQPERAVELLEQGRGVLLARVLEARTDHGALRDHAPALADQLAEVLDALHRMPDTRTPAPDQAARTANDHRADLARRRDALLAEVRSLPGFGDFLRPPRFATLRAAAANGPVVLLNASRHGCDALLLTRDGVRVLPLRCSVEELLDRATAFTQALVAARDPEPGDEDGELTRFEARNTVTDVLGWLWDTVAGPLLAELPANGRLDDGGCPRLWWCPTSLFTLLPLHAAGHHAPGGEAVLDRVVSSYTPTLRALLHAREHAQDASGAPPRRLVVSLPCTPGWPDLPNAEREAADLLARYPDAESLTGRAAESTAVLDALARCSWAHFACHGAQALEQPSLGALFLYDRPLLLREIMELRLDRASLAFLSACDSSRGGLRLANEAISFAAALHVAGFRHVIGTLWPINDALAPEVAALVYDELARRGTDFTAAALHDAIRRTRSRYPRAPLTWAPYVHIGP
ncbi:CHAT domain-containing protein [Streptantibioticus rubrisoli]|uniref:CHAT domain-containing protein n=1 Tax=Streptantibioticus rubrisoli TaxID=1387313 RepID=A0ABT1PCS9_9ACTN|nr:CHAT domain-containing protein [Streptantibioticus rubrisoli]MCQ4042043.1 CHAT domain-containing protein [Streptantibioticus rubrisoli]